MTQHFVLASLILLATSSPAQKNQVPESSVKVTFTSGNETHFPFQALDEPLIEVKLNDNPRPLFFSIDSGSSATYLSRATARQLHLSPSGSDTVHGAGSGTVTVRHLHDVRFHLPGVTTLHTEINTADLGGIEVGGHRLDGFFGFDFIRRFVITIDYDAKRVTLTDPERFVYNGRGEVLPIDFHGKWPFVPGTIKVPGVAPEKSLFLVDTGSGDAVNHPLIKQSKGRLVATRTGVGLGKPGEGVMGNIEYVHFGNLELRDAPSVCCGGNRELNVHGHIGNDALRRFKVILDYSRDRIILEPGKMYDQPF